MMNIDPYDDPDNDRVKYSVEYYCKKYPDDQGNQRIYAKDVVRPRNHKWADQAEQSKWRSSYCLKTELNNDNGIYYKRRAPTYGTCAECWASGPTAINPVNNTTRFYTCL
jgi:hypothetical protein